MAKKKAKHPKSVLDEFFQGTKKMLDEPDEDEGELSPIQMDAPEPITREQFEACRKILGDAGSLFIAKVKKNHQDCDPEVCTGHGVAIRSDGFSPSMLHGLGHAFLDDSAAKGIASSHKNATI